MLWKRRGINLMRDKRLVPRFLLYVSLGCALFFGCAASTRSPKAPTHVYSDTLATAVAFREARDLKAAEQELERVIALPLSPTVRSHTLWELYLVHRDGGDALPALQALVSCLSVDGGASWVYGRAQSSLGPAVADALHAGASWMTISDSLGSIEDVPLLLDVAAFLLDEGECFVTSRFLGRLARRGLDPEDEHRRAGLADKTARCLERNRLAVALILPLSGEYAEYGNSLARGAELALEDSSIYLVLERLDSKSDPVAAVMLTEQLASSPHVIAAVGPLQSRAATGAALAANDGRLPLLVPLLAPRDLARMGTWVFQSAAPLQAEARTVAKYAMVQGGLSRFAVLYPAHATGERAMEAFRNHVYELGGEIVAIERYTEGRDTNFRDQIVSIKRASPQALFVPGEPRELVQIARQVAFYELECQLLGTSGWSAPEVIEQGKRLVEGVILADLADVSKDPTAAEFFRARYNDRFDRDPDHYAALGYDLTRCVVLAVKDGKTTRESIRRFLREIGPVDGVSGVLNWSDDDSPGNVKLFTIADGLIIPLPS
jgi:branched-chain amino acid transport system substrate-binding protein